jgi:hypothetical protein
MSFPGLIIVILQGPKTAPEIEAKGNGFPNIGLGHEGLDLKTFRVFILVIASSGVRKGALLVLGSAQVRKKGRIKKRGKK